MREQWKSLRVYSLFAATALVCVVVLLQFEVPFAHPSQKESLAPLTFLPIILLGCLGAWLWPRVGLGALPAGGAAWRQRVVTDMAIGISFGLLAVLLDWSLGFSSLFARKLNIPSIHVPFPYSALTYTAGTLAVESIYRIIPIPILAWLICNLALRGRWTVQVFWVLALLTSLIEPISQAGLLSDHPVPLVAIGTMIFTFNMIEAWLLRNYGVASPIIARLSLYAVWHVLLGPALG